jgi:hypothetical protein
MHIQLQLAQSTPYQLIREETHREIDRLLGLVTWGGDTCDSAGTSTSSDAARIQ